MKNKLWYVKQIRMRTTQDSSERFAIFNFNNEKICEYATRDILDEMCMCHNLIILDGEE